MHAIGCLHFRMLRECRRAERRRRRRDLRRDVRLMAMEAWMDYVWSSDYEDSAAMHALFVRLACVLPMEVVQSIHQQVIQ